MRIWKKKESSPVSAFLNLMQPLLTAAPKKGLSRCLKEVASPKS